MLNPEWSPEVDDDEVSKYIDIEIPLNHEEILEQCNPTMTEMACAIDTARNEVFAFSLSVLYLIPV